MAQASGQRNVQGKQVRIVNITIPANNSENQIVNLLPARITDKQKANIIGCRIYAQVEAGTDRGAFNFGDIDTEMYGYVGAGEVWYVAATESVNMYVESTDGSTVAAVAELLIG